MENWNKLYAPFTIVLSLMGTAIWLGYFFSDTSF